MNARGKTNLAFWLETASHHACEIAALAGFRTVVLDMEHGAIDERAAELLVPYCERLGLDVAVRVAAAERVAVQHALDAGAHAVVLPQIRDLAQAREAAALAKFPPLGTRGIGYSRTMGYSGAPDDYPAQENARRLCYVMIETPGALADASAIAALECVDGLFLGPGDLSLTSGRGINRWRERDRADLATVAKAARSAGKLWALPAVNEDVFRLARSLEPAFIAVADDLGALHAGFEASVRTFEAL